MNAIYIKWIIFTSIFISSCTDGSRINKRTKVDAVTANGFGLNNPSEQCFSASANSHALGETRQNGLYSLEIRLNGTISASSTFSNEPYWTSPRRNIQNQEEITGECYLCESGTDYGDQLGSQNDQDSNDGMGLMLAQMATLQIDGRGMVINDGSVDQYWFYHDQDQELSNPGVCITNDGEVVYTDVGGAYTYSLIDERVIAEQTEGDAQYRGVSVQDFDTGDLRVWENAYQPVRGGLGNGDNVREYRLSFVDVTFDDDDTSGKGVGYDFSDLDKFVSPQELANNYQAYLLCYEWDDEDNEVVRFYHNYSPLTIYNTDDFFGVKFEDDTHSRVGSSGFNKCLIEISEKTESSRTVYRQKDLVASLDRDTGYWIFNQELDETLTVVNTPRHNSFEAESADIDSLVYEEINLDHFLNLLQAEKRIKYLLVSATGERTGNRPNRTITYSTSCRRSDGTNTTCFDNSVGVFSNNENDDEESDESIRIANEDALLTNIEACGGDGRCADIAKERPFIDDHFGGSISANELFSLKAIDAAFVTLDGTRYLLNPCLKETDSNSYRCAYDEKLSAMFAEKYAGLTKKAKRFLVWSKVRGWIAVIAVMILVLVGAAVAYAGSFLLVLTSGVTGISNISVAFAAKVAAAVGAVGSFINSIGFTVATASIALIGVSTSVPQLVLELKECTNEECRVNSITDLTLLSTESVLDVFDLASVSFSAFKIAEAILPLVPRGVQGKYVSSVKYSIFDTSYDLSDLTEGMGFWSGVSDAARQDLINTLIRVPSDDLKSITGGNDEFFSRILSPSRNLADDDVYALIFEVSKRFFRVPFTNYAVSSPGGVCAGAVSEWLKRIKRGATPEGRRDFDGEDVAHLMETNIAYMQGEEWGSHIETDSIWSGNDAIHTMQKNNVSGKFDLYDPWLLELSQEPGTFAALRTAVGEDHVIGLIYLEGQYHFFDPNTGWLSSKNPNIIKEVLNESFDQTDIFWVYYGSINDGSTTNLNDLHFHPDGTTSPRDQSCDNVIDLVCEWE